MLLPLCHKTVIRTVIGYSRLMNVERRKPMSDIELGHRFAAGGEDELEEVINLTVKSC